MTAAQLAALLLACHTGAPANLCQTAHIFETQHSAVYY
jgi:hypothetical protein